MLRTQMQEKQVAVLNVKKQTKKRELKEDCENGAGTAGFTVPAVCGAGPTAGQSGAVAGEDHPGRAAASPGTTVRKDKMPAVSSVD